MNLDSDYKISLSPINPEIFDREMLEQTPKSMNRRQMIHFAKLAIGISNRIEEFKNMSPIESLSSFFTLYKLDGETISIWDDFVFRVLCESPSCVSLLNLEIELQQTLNKGLLSDEDKQKIEELKTRINEAVAHNQETTAKRVL